MLLLKILGCVSVLIQKGRERELNSAMKTNGQKHVIQLSNKQAKPKLQAPRSEPFKSNNSNLQSDPIRAAARMQLESVLSLTECAL